MPHSIMRFLRQSPEENLNTRFLPNVFVSSNRESMILFFMLMSIFLNKIFTISFPFTKDDVLPAAPLLLVPLTLMLNQQIDDKLKDSVC